MKACIRLQVIPIFTVLVQGVCRTTNVASTIRRCLRCCVVLHALCTAAHGIARVICRHPNYSRCSCGRCVPMNTEHESVCCREVERANALIAAGTDCITLHPTFNRVCLDVHVVEVAYYWLMEDRPSQVDDPEIHRRYRYTAYRQFTRWIWHRLGRRNRVVLPSCVVSAIRGAFLSEEYCGFRYPEY